MNIRERIPYDREAHREDMVAFVSFWDTTDLVGREFRQAVEEAVGHWADTAGVALDPRKGFWECAAFYRDRDLREYQDHLPSAETFRQQFECEFPADEDPASV